MTDTTYSADALRAAHALHRFAGPGNPWINEFTENSGRWWIHADLISDDSIGSYSGVSNACCASPPLCSAANRSTCTRIFRLSNTG